MDLNKNPSPVEKIEAPILEEFGVELYLKREDKNHLLLSGNKLRKLKYNLLAAQKEGKNLLLSFGGAFSNHIYSLAAAGKLYNFRTIGVIRGEATNSLNSTLQFAQDCGMEIHFVSRERFREKEENEFIEELKNQFGDFYHIPEGGSNDLAVKGCAEIVDEIDISFQYICCAVGTGGTFAGLVSGLKGKNKAIGFSALKGEGILDEKVRDLIKSNGIDYGNWEINYNYHFGGYAKINKDLVVFINDFYFKHKIQLEPIYTGKMIYGIFDLVGKGYFNRGDKIVALHTGGLQGLEGMKPLMEKCLDKKESNLK